MNRYSLRSQGSDNLLGLELELGAYERERRRERQREIAMDPQDNVNQDDLALLADQQLLAAGRGNGGQNPPGLPALGVGRAAHGAIPDAGIPDARRTIAEHGRGPAFYTDRGAIRPGGIERRDYEIKTGLINLVEKNQFHGLPSENPMQHVERFQNICNTVKSNGVSEDWLKCKLFPFSLTDKAARWVNSLVPGSLTTWEATKAAFLAHFFTRARSLMLRNKISSFQQLGAENFHEAWERFKDYTVECPHHGYSDVDLLNLFYHGINEKYQNSLDVASNGDFTTKTVEEGYLLVNNMADSQANRRSEFDRSKGVAAIDSKKIEEIVQAKLDGILKKDNRAVHFLNEATIFDDLDAEESEEYQEEVNYVGNQGSFGNRGFRQFQNNNSGNNGFQQRQQFGNLRGNNQSGFQSQGTTSTGQSSGYDELKNMMQKLMENQSKTASDMGHKVDAMYNDLNGKIEVINTHIKILETQVAQTSAGSRVPPGTLPAKPEQNPREYCNAISLTSENLVSAASRTAGHLSPDRNRDVA